MTYLQNLDFKKIGKLEKSVRKRFRTEKLAKKLRRYGNLGLAALVSLVFRPTDYMAYFLANILCFCRWIRDRSEMGLRVTPTILRDHVQRIMSEKPGPCLSKNGIPGRKWFAKFFARHPEISILKSDPKEPVKREPKEPVKRMPKEKPKPEMKHNVNDRVALGDAALLGMSAFFEQSLLEERAFERSLNERSLNERKIFPCRDPNAESLTLNDFESAVGRELIEQLRNELHVENRSEEFQALHRLWRMFPANSPNSSSMGS